jgi:hypothetical protein
MARLAGFEPGSSAESWFDLVDVEPMASCSSFHQERPTAGRVYAETLKYRERLGPCLNNFANCH